MHLAGLDVPSTAHVEVRPAAGPWRRLKRGCLRAFQAGLETAGVASLYVRFGRVTGATILSFHSVADSGTAAWLDPRYHLDSVRFERQMRFIAARRKPISLTRLVEELEAGRELPPRTVAVTLDDGYLDHRTVAAPLLAKYGIPATFFIPTGCVSRGENQWIDRLFSAFRRRTRHELADGVSRRFDIRRPSEEAESFRELQNVLTVSDASDRTRLLESVEEQLRPEGKAPRLNMDWSDVRALRDLSPDFEIGGHTRDHVDLGSRAIDVESQVSRCAEDLRRELGEGSRHFCYPYERWTAAAGEAVRRAGFRSGVGAGEENLVTSRSDRFALPRIDAPARQSTFGFVTSGAYPGLSRALTGRA